MNGPLSDGGPTGTGGRMVRLDGHRILVVEDEEIIAAMLEECLLDVGAAVIGFAATLTEARAMLTELKPDGVLLDLNLDGVDARPLMQQLRDMRMPFLVTTGHDRE